MWLEYARRQRGEHGHELLASILSPAIVATLLVVLPTPTSVVIASDSKGVDAADPARPQIHCKMFCTADLVFGASGYTECPGYSVHAIAKAAALLLVPFLERLHTFEREMLSALPEAVRRHIAAIGPFSHRTVVNAVFVGLEHGVIKRSERDFVLTDQRGTIAIDRRQDFPNAVSKHGQFNVFGNGAPDVADVVHNAIATKILLHVDPAVFCRQLIEAGIRRRPDILGPPVNIAAVTPSGPEWITRHKDCPGLTK